MSKKRDDMREEAWRREAIDCLRSVGVKNCPADLIDEAVKLLRERDSAEQAAENRLLEEI